MEITSILKEKKNFTYIETLISDYLLEKQEDIANQSARSIASKLNTAPSSLTRFVQKIGFAGFTEFKTAYLKELDYLASHFNEINPNYPFDYNDKNVVVANKMGQLYQETVKDQLNLIHHDGLQLAINILQKARTVYVCSAGVQIDVARTFKEKMVKIGKDVVIEDKLDDAFSRASFCLGDCAFILISYSGETDQLLRIAAKLKGRQVKTVALTSYGSNSLASMADVSLYVSSREKLIENLGDFSMNLSTLFMLDVLYMNIFNDDYQTNYSKKVASSKGFQKNRTTKNPLLQD